MKKIVYFGKIVKEENFWERFLQVKSILSFTLPILKFDSVPLFSCDVLKRLGNLIKPYRLFWIIKI